MTPVPDKQLARVTCVLLIVMTIAAIFAQFVVRTPLLAAEPAGVARRILASEQTFRLGFLGYLLAYMLDVPVAVLLYVILKPTHRSLAAVMAAFRLVYTAVVGAVLLLFFGGLLVLQGDLSAFEPAQVQQLAALFTSLFDSGFHLSLMFFAVHLLLLGILLFRSRRVPRWLSALVAAGGLAYLLDNVLFFLAPSLQATVGPVLGMIAMGEVVLAFWMLFKGVADAPAREMNAPVAEGV